MTKTELKKTKKEAIELLNKIAILTADVEVNFDDDGYETGSKQELLEKKFLIALRKTVDSFLEANGSFDNLDDYYTSGLYC